jgi:ketosteroid isomerase-like protein
VAHTSNVDVVRSVYGYWERGDILGSASLFTPDFEFARVGADLGILAGEWRGVEQAWKAIGEWMSSGEDLHIHVDEIFELDDGRVGAFGRRTGRGVSSGVRMEHDTGWCQRSPESSVRPRKRAARRRLFHESKPAASYSPGPLRAKYHRR